MPATIEWRTRREIEPDRGGFKRKHRLSRCGRYRVTEAVGNCNPPGRGKETRKKQLARRVYAERAYQMFNGRPGWEPLPDDHDYHKTEQAAQKACERHARKAVRAAAGGPFV